MELKILSENQNLLFDRKEISATITTTITPSNTEVKKLICEKFSIDPEKLHLIGIKGKFGSQTFNIEAHIYSSTHEKNKILVKTKKQRKNEAKAFEEAQKAEAEEKKKAEEEKKVAEKPAEENEPDQKTENKPEETQPNKEPIATEKPEVKEE